MSIHIGRPSDCLVVSTGRDLPARLRVWCASALLPEGWRQRVRIEFAGNRIVAVTTDAPRESADIACDIALPGLPNVHSHAFQRAMAGLAEQRKSATDNFWSWREWMYRFVERMTPDDIEIITRYAYVEMLEAGFTQVGEFHYVHNDQSGARYTDAIETSARIIAAAQATGIGLTLLPVLYRHGGFGGIAASTRQRRFVLAMDDYLALVDALAAHATRESILVGIAPHSLRAVSPADLGQLLAVHRQGPVHIHAAEQIAEVTDCLAWSGQRPVEWLLEHAGVDKRWCVVHATHINETELVSLARTGATVGVCPITEANLGDGIFRAHEFLAAGGHIGIGSDSNVEISVTQELKLLEYGQRLTTRQRSVLASDTFASPARRLYNAALEGGSQALGHESAGLAVGARADLVTLDSEHASLAHRAGDALLDSWVMTNATAIEHVWSGGKHVVRSGRHVARDEIAHAYRNTLGALLS